MKIMKLLFYILICIMLIGGILGIIKGLIPNTEGLSLRSILRMGTTFKADAIPSYALAFGLFMSVFEIISSILLLTKKRRGIEFAIITLSINAFGCIIAILLGDIMAIGSLMIRFSAIYILIKYKRYYVVLGS